MSSAEVSGRLALLALAAACGTPTASTEHQGPAEVHAASATSALRPTAPEAPVRHALDLVGCNGLSALTADDDGLLWAAPERDDLLVAIDPQFRVRTVPLSGVPSGFDIESLAYLGGRRFALGTEANAPPGAATEHDAGLILIAELSEDGDSARIIERIEVDYGQWNVRIGDNQGIEGLCAIGDILLLGVEQPLIVEGRRYAPVGVLDRKTGATSAFRVPLTTPTGKLAAMDCHTRSGSIVEAIAIERNFGVARILRFAVDLDDTGYDPVSAELARDLDAFAATTRLNFEGLYWREDGSFVLAVDNQYRGISGPNELVVVPPAR